MADDRVMDLEVKVAFQEHTIATLDEELRKTMDRLEALERRVEELVAEHQSSVERPIVEKPPHY